MLDISTILVRVLLPMQQQQQQQQASWAGPGCLIGMERLLLDLPQQVKAVRQPSPLQHPVITTRGWLGGLPPEAAMDMVAVAVFCVLALHLQRSSTVQGRVEYSAGQGVPLLFVLDW